MALVYLDPTALVRLCVSAPGSDLACALWERADTVVSSRMSDTHVRALLAPAAESAASWSRLSAGIAFVEFAGPVAARAAELADAGMTPLDAVQVASALAVHHDDTVVATWDADVAGALRARGVRVVP